MSSVASSFGGGATRELDFQLIISPVVHWLEAKAILIGMLGQNTVEEIAEAVDITGEL